jgi:hypothetical protein
MIETLVGQPDSLRADVVTIFIAIAVHLTSPFYNSFLFLLKGRLVVLGEVDDFPIFLVNCIRLGLLCRAKMALESPTLAHVSFLSD